MRINPNLYRSSDGCQYLFVGSTTRRSCAARVTAAEPAAGRFDIAVGFDAGGGTFPSCGKGGASERI